MLRSNYLAYFIFIFILVSTTHLLGQGKTKAQLQKEKSENLQKIREAESILKETEKQKKATIGQLNALNQEIRSRESLIRSISEEIKWYDEKISDNQQIVNSLRADLENLKNEYAEMVYAGYKASQNQDKLTFLFSSKSFNQFIIRLKYFEQYGEARRYQAQQIVKVDEVLNVEISGFVDLKKEKEGLLKEEVNEKNNLTSLKSKQVQLVTSLSKRENEIRKELDSRKNSIAAITSIIDKMIRDEMKAKALNTAPELMVISANFAGNKQRLPWPVKEGFISSGYGKHAHPVYKRVVIDNKGVYIQTKSKEVINAVFDGKVSVVASIPGMNKAVIVQHGEYRTVYANLQKVYVERNQKIKINDKIGEIYTDTEGLSELYFEVWKKNATLNPQLWLTKK